MVVISAIAAAIGLGVAATQLVLLAASVAYQQAQARKAKKAANAAADSAKGIEVRTEFQSEPLPIVYGLNMVGGNVVWGQTRNNYVHTFIPTLGLGMPPWTVVTSSRQLFDLLASGDGLAEGSLILWNDKVYSRNSVAFVDNIGDEGPLFQLSPELFLSTYFTLSDAITEGVYRIDTASIVRRPFFGPTVASGSRSSTGELFSQALVPGIDYTHNTLLPPSTVVIPATLAAGAPVGYTQTGSRNEFLFVQQAISVGGINRVITAKVDGKSVDEADFGYGQRIDVSLNGVSSTNPMIANNIPSSDRSNALFSNMAHASMCFRLNRDEPQYASVPRVEFLVEGQKVRDIENPSEGVYVLAEQPTYSNNSALVLLDYLTNTTYGRGLSIAEIDLESFYKAKLICDTVVSETVQYTGYAALARGATVSTETIVDVARLYEANLVLDTDRDVWENVQAILDTMNDPSLIWSEGRYKLLLDFPRSQAEQEALIAIELTEEDIVSEDTVELLYPSQDERLNQCTVRFRNSNKSFKDDSVTWPKKNSSVLSAYLVEDNGLELKSDLYLAGVVDPYHAQNIAEQIVRESRFGALITLSVRRKGFYLEPGDLVKINLTSLGLVQTARVIELEVKEGLVVLLKLRLFSWEALAWNVPDDLPGITIPAPQVVLEPPTGVVFDPQNSASLNNMVSGRLSWDASDNAEDLEYIVSAQRSGDESWLNLGVTTSNFFEVGQLSEGIYLIAVQSRSILSGKTSLRAMAEFRLDPVNAPLDFNVTQQPFNIRFVWSPDTDRRVIGYSVYSDIFLQNRLGQSSSNFFDWPVRQNCAICSSGTSKTIYIVSDYSDGKQSQPSAITFEVQPPSITNLTQRFDQGNIVLSWSDNSNQFAVDRYRVDSEGQPSNFVYASSYSQVARWIGAREWVVTPIDVAGNEGIPIYLSIQVQPPSDIAPLQSKVVINNVLLNWSAPLAGSLPIKHYELRRGNTLGGSTLLGVFQGTFSSVFEEVAGEFRYWVSAVDLADNYGPWSFVDAQVAAPRGFVFLTSQSTAAPTVPIAPIDRTETWSEHFTTNGFNTIQDQILAGGTRYIHPAAPFEDFEFEFDLGAVSNAFQIQFNSSLLQLESTPTTNRVFISHKVGVADPWSVESENSTVFVSSARYVRVRVRIESPGISLAEINELVFKALVIQKDDSGTVDVLGTDVDGTVVNFNTEFIDITSIVLTVKNSTVPVIPIYVFNDIPNPTSFAIKVFDLNGSRVNATVSWSASGV